MFVLLTDILDTFGDLVFERIKKKGVDEIGSKTTTELPGMHAHSHQVLLHVVAEYTLLGVCR
jgi:hypothetical protein